MSLLEDMSGPERAAALLVAVGPESAAEILKHLDEKDIELISAEIAKTGSLTAEERAELLTDFYVSLKKARLKKGTGKEGARSILEKAFDEDTSARIMKKVSAKDLDSEFAFFQNADAAIMLKVLEKEAPQMIAVILSYLPSAVSAGVLKNLPKDKAKAVALRIARLDTVAPEAVLDVARRLKTAYKQQEANMQRQANHSGVESLTQIISHMGYADGRQLMENLDAETPEISQSIRDKAMSFDSVLGMTNSEIRELIDAVGDDVLIATALKGADEDIKFRFLRNMSRNRAEDIINDMNQMGAIRKSDAEAARVEVAKSIRLLFESGVIRFQKADDTYIE